MKYWTIVYNGEYGQNVQETFSEDQIVTSYYRGWAINQLRIRHGNADITREACIDDWIHVHWAVETDQWGNKIETQHS